MPLPLASSARLTGQVFSGFHIEWAACRIKVCVPATTSFPGDSFRFSLNISQPGMPVKIPVRTAAASSFNDHRGPPCRSPPRQISLPLNAPLGPAQMSMSKIGLARRASG